MSKESNLKNSIILSFLICMGLAFKLWYGPDRAIPEVPLIDSSIVSSNFYQIALIGILIASLLASLFEKFYRYTIILAVFAFALLILDDINRLQAYYYQLMFMLLLLAFMHKRSQEQKVTVMYLVIVGVYFHTGLVKWNDNFVQFVFPNMLYAYYYVSLETWREFPFQELAYSIPIMEMAVAVLLIIPRSRKIGLISAIILHLGILYSIGPFGLKLGAVIIFWNISMIVFNVILYLESQKTTPSIKNVYSLGSFWLALIFFCLLPFLNRMGKWDNALSFSVYSGTTPNVQMHLNQTDDLLDAPLFYIEQDTFIDLNYWSFKELNSSIYGQEWVFDKISKQLCEDLDCRERVFFEVYKESISYVE
jgi:hypothetical protein